MTNVLITGIGAPLGQSIAKAALKSNLPINLYVSDNTPQAAGFYYINAKPILTPSVKDPNYFEFMVHTVNAKEISFIIPSIRVESLRS